MTAQVSVNTPAQLQATDHKGFPALQEDIRPIDDRTLADHALATAEIAEVKRNSSVRALPDGFPEVADDDLVDPDRFAALAAHTRDYDQLYTLADWRSRVVERDAAAFAIADQNGARTKLRHYSQTHGKVVDERAGRYVRSHLLDGWRRDAEQAHADDRPGGDDRRAVLAALGDRLASDRRVQRYGSETRDGRATLAMIDEASAKARENAHPIYVSLTLTNAAGWIKRAAHHVPTQPRTWRHEAAAFASRLEHTVERRNLADAPPRSAHALLARTRAVADDALGRAERTSLRGGDTTATAVELERGRRVAATTGALEQTTARAEPRPMRGAMAHLKGLTGAGRSPLRDRGDER